MSKLNPPETAPKDEIILVDVGMPWLFIGKFSPSDNEWVVAEPSMSFHGNDKEWWFENEYYEDILGWLPMPAIERGN